MKILTLLRHAKSSWDDDVARDFDRPLNPRGRRAAQAIGGAMREAGLAFDIVLASPAVRVAETLAEVERSYGAKLPVRSDPRIYLAAPDTLLQLLAEACEGAQRVLIVGHNPGLEMLALSLSAGGSERAEIAVKFPTAALAEIEFDVEDWGELGEGQGRLTRFIRPRELDPNLGPDAD